MDSERIILNKYRNKASVNKDVLLDVDFESEEKKFPIDNISTNINQFKQYVREYDESNKYRFVFTINSICSNVLFNRVSEIVKNEGSDSCVFYGKDGISVSKTNNPYIGYKYGTDTKVFNREGLIRDTACSHEKLGGLVYHCGIDIFNNHLLRQNGFAIVNKLQKANSDFNEIGDELRDWRGETETFPVFSGEMPEHLYTKETISSYRDTIFDKLIEEDGWFGFNNTTGIYNNNNVTISNSLYLTINKCMNNNEPCEFIDLYPDRSLFSFIPKNNKHRNRVENNWDYCLTYPYENYTGNTLVSFIKNNEQVLNGINGEFCDEFNNTLDINDLLGDAYTKEHRDLIVRTKFKNNIKNGDYVRIHLVGSITQKRKTQEVSYESKTNCLVKSTGLNGYNDSYYFTISLEDIMSDLKSFSNNIGRTISNLYCYVQRVVDDRPCKYYFRKFKRIPNFKDSNVYLEDGLTKEEINSVCLNDFDSSLNKLGFGLNIYNDRMAQIVYNDTIDLTNLYDNLGRELHEVFLTIVKCNKGYQQWYGINTSDKKPVYTNYGIEYSHCFGEITSGVEMTPYAYDYNVHRIHNVDKKVNDATVNLLPDNYNPLERNIIIKGANSTKLDLISGKTDNGVFLGDIVELNENNVEETVLETVCHRFNTVQREIVSDEFSKVSYDEIIKDDSDDAFAVEYGKSYTGSYRANIAPEGYYYKAHYGILLKRFDDEVNEGQHTFMKFDSISYTGNTITAKTDRNYYLLKDDIIYIFYDKIRYDGIVRSVEGEDFRNITIEVVLPSGTNIKKTIIMKPNSEMPSTAYDFNDGSGIYKWRDFVSCENIKYDDELYDTVFTNGAKYFHKNINFFLRRQDPFGTYGLNPINMGIQEFVDLDIEGLDKDITEAESLTNGETTIC